MPIGWSWGWSIGGLRVLSWEDSFTLIFDISNITILISSVGHNLGARVGEDNSVRSTGLVSITALRVSKVVGVRVTHSILKVVLGSNISIHLSWGIGWGRGISWGRCRCIGRGRCWSVRSWCRSWSVRGIIWPGNCYSNDSREDKDLELGRRKKSA